MIKKPKHFTPPTVNRYYNFDWQYAVDIYKATFLRFISVIFLILPLIINSEQVNVISIPLGFLIASGTFILAMLIIYLFCPRFIREYRDFGQYNTRQSSHRWIIWEFYINLKSLSEWKTILKETVSKGISVELNEITDTGIRTELEKSFRQGKRDSEITVYKPLNINRDIYLPIRLEKKKMILFLEEKDKNLAEKEKELFWILYSQAAKERVIARVIFWVLIGLTIIISLWTVISIILNIACNR